MNHKDFLKRGRGLVCEMLEKRKTKYYKRVSLQGKVPGAMSQDFSLVVQSLLVKQFDAAEVPAMTSMTAARRMGDILSTKRDLRRVR